MRTYTKTEIHTYQKTGMRCGECDTPFFEDIEVDVPIEKYAKQMRSIRCPNCYSDKLYLGLSLSLSEDRQRRIDGGSIPARIDDWLENGEIGLSSVYLANFMRDRQSRQISHPNDYDDLRRVLLLVDRIPEWNPRMSELSGIAGWEMISTRWEEIKAAVAAADPELRRPTAASDLLEEIFQRKEKQQ